MSDEEFNYIINKIQRILRSARRNATIAMCLNVLTVILLVLANLDKILSV